MGGRHEFSVGLRWGGEPEGSSSSRDSRWRDHALSSTGKPEIQGSSAGAFHGDTTRWNPEELLVAALAQCHFLSYLYLCQREGIALLDYSDAASGILRTHPDGSGEMTEVVLTPRVVVDRADVERAASLHERAHELCFIARSVAFPVRVLPELVPSS